MHSLKILPLSPRSPFWSFSLASPAVFPPCAVSPPPQPPHPALSRCHRSSRTLRAVIVVLVLWLVRETFSGLLLGESETVIVALLLKRVFRFANERGRL